MSWSPKRSDFSRDRSLSSSRPWRGQRDARSERYGKSFSSQVDRPEGSENWERPWAQMKYFTYHPTVYSRFIGAVSPDAKPGDLVHLYGRDGKRFGAGYYNPGARVPLRVIWHGEERIPDLWESKLIEVAVQWRLQTLKLDSSTEAYRVIHSDGDRLGGLVVDRYGDCLMIEVHSLAVWKRLPVWLAQLHDLLGTTREVVRVDPVIAKIEGIKADPPRSIPPIKIREHGLVFEVNLEEGHKTGFFCDQRENRFKLGELVAGIPSARVLDLCCYSGGFSISAKLKGQAEEVTGVDLDEKAIAQAKRNGNLNQARGIRWVHADAFDYARQMGKNGEQYDVVILDPPKLLFSREGMGEGLRKYEDLNRLGMALVKPGGILVTCSCSGLIGPSEFEDLVIRASQKAGKRLQIFDQTGAGADHPVMSNCLESRYLKVIWSRVWPGVLSRRPLSHEVEQEHTESH